MAQPSSAVASSCSARSGGRLLPEPPERDQQWLVDAARQPRALEQHIDQRRVHEQVDPRRAKRQTRDAARRRPPATAHGSFGPGPPESSRRQATHRTARSTPDGLVGWVRGEDEASGGGGPGSDPLGEPLRVVLDEPDGPLDDLPRAAVVHLEVDPAQRRQVLWQARGSGARRPVASHRSTGRRRRPGRSGCAGAASSSASRSWARSTSWTSSTSSSVQRSRQRASSAASASRRPIARRIRSSKSSAAACRNGRLVRDERPSERSGFGVRGDSRGRDARLDLEPRDDGVHPRVEPARRPRAPPRRGSPPCRPSARRRRRRHGGSRARARGTSEPAPPLARRPAARPRHQAARSSRPPLAC